jgi:hypothetical protein
MLPAACLRNCSGSVYRVNWLRAKARKERWEEEMQLVTSEMDWTVRCFQHHGGIWKQRAEKAEYPGHEAYAWKQGSTWDEWAKTAEEAFRALKGA